MLESNFSSAGLKCAGTLYLPEPAEVKPAVVILAHGFCVEKSFRLPTFAERFREAGFAAYLFDYRCFGGSEGERAIGSALRAIWPTGGLPFSMSGACLTSIPIGWLFGELPSLGGMC
jgi:hypothetical protein